MQWNLVEPVAGRTSRILGDEAAWYYFVHSYAPVPATSGGDMVAATCDYGGTVVAAVERDLLFGTQFHPEKSARRGLDLLSRFAGLCET